MSLHYSYHSEAKTCGYANMSSHQVDNINLPPTKIKRTYKCKNCDHSTVNPREHLNHLKGEHDQNVKIVECPLCLYACQYRQKLNRHLKLVHRCSPNLTPLLDVNRQISTMDATRPNFTICSNPQTTPQDVVECFKSIACQKTIHYYSTTDEPMDLSFSSEIKEILKAVQSAQTQSKWYNYQS